jgi:hypothetical protein
MFAAAFPSPPRSRRPCTPPSSLFVRSVCLPNPNSPWVRSSTAPTRLSRATKTSSRSQESANQSSPRSATRNWPRSSAAAHYTSAAGRIPNSRDRTVIVVDDGIATGPTRCGLTSGLQAPATQTGFGGTAQRRQIWEALPLRRVEGTAPILPWQLDHLRCKRARLRRMAKFNSKSQLSEEVAPKRMHRLTCIKDSPRGAFLFFFGMHGGRS